MICPNCGAHLADDALVCPYCDGENEEAAVNKQKREIASVYSKIAALLRLPERIVQRTTIILLCITAVLVNLFFISLAWSFVYSRVSPETQYRVQQKNIENLEKLYQQGDYEDLNRTLEKIGDSYRSVYAKYETVSRIYEDLQAAEEYLDDILDFVSQDAQRSDMLEYDTARLFGVLNECSELKEAGYIYGEEAAVEKLSEEAYSLLRDKLLLTDEEISEGMLIASQDESDYGQLCKISAQRLSGGM